MNFIGRHDHIGGYRRVNPSGYGVPFWGRSGVGTSGGDGDGLDSMAYAKPSCSWKWRKGSRVSTINDWVQIKIGGDEEAQKKKPQQLNRIKSTKYTIITFLPQNLLEQFRRIANFYFLAMTLISLLIDSPVSPMTSLLPLVFVISVTAAKQGYEDYLRYKTDNIVNRAPVTVIRNGEETHIQSQYVMPGDLVVVERDCDVPCDLVLLRSSDPHGKCFITTANLDGESNLKTLLVPRDLPKVEINRMHKLGVIECETPKTDLYSFNGKIELSGGEGRVLPLTAENVLLRGSRVKNTECVIGCAVYTGMTTKLQLNSRLTRNKTASSEVYINRFLIAVLVALIAIVTLMYFMKRYVEMFVVSELTYLGPPLDNYSVRLFLQDYLSFLILFNYLIPISLYVTIEVVRIFGGFFMEWDVQMYDEEYDEHLIVNTSNLNEELGQINILFSDKTGTLTKNEMYFQQCSINGRKFLFKKTRLQEEGSTSMFDINKFNTDQRVFFQSLAICHTVQVAGTLDGNSSNSSGTGNGKSNSGDSGRGSSETKSKDSTPSDKQSPLGKMYSMADITEENHNSSQLSEVNQVDCATGTINAVSSGGSPPVNGNGTTGSTTTSDVNPLLDELNKGERRKRPVIVKRSPNFARATSRIQPVSPTSSVTDNGNAIELVVTGGTVDRHVFFTSSLNTVPTGRPSSLQISRSTSDIDLPEFAAALNSAQCHRRTQSYGTPGAYITQQPGVTGGVNRDVSTHSRESYAAPSFQRQPTLLIRAESQRRKIEMEQIMQSLDYQASSPDEKALVEAAASLGLMYMGDDDEILRVRVVPPHMDYARPVIVGQPNEMQFERLHVLEFTSDRKRMSVIVRDETGTRWIYTKGAESYVFPLCANSSNDLVAKTDVHISDFARQGLRTLAIARRRIDKEEYEEFVAGISEANSSLENRKELSAACYSKIEKDLDLLGATAVEDALQDDVADTLISLQKAGIKIWVLTGDKVETALNIALSCGHIPPNALKYFIIECTNKDDLLVHFSALDREVLFGMGRECALLIDGKSLSVALAETPTEFRDVAIKCTAVLCCRLSPLQKSEVVTLIKTSPQNYITAAIGDGANDVSMIQAADVGIGIMGREGRQAARCSDFAFAKFCILKRLLLVHGFYHTKRLALLVLYFFYKNFYLMGAMFLFQFDALFSGTSVYDSLYLTLYNVVYTALPVGIIAVTEKPYPEEYLMRNPQLYSTNTNNRPLHWPYFLLWTFYSIYHSVVTYYFTYLVFYDNDVILNIGQTAEFSCFGTVLIQIIVIVCNLKLWLESRYMSFLYIASILLSILAFMITTAIYNVINLSYDTDIYWVYNKLMASLPQYLLTILATISCLLPDFLFSVALKGLNLPKRSFFPGKERLRKLQLRRKVESTYL